MSLWCSCLLGMDRRLFRGGGCGRGGVLLWLIGGRRSWVYEVKFLRYWTDGMGWTYIAAMENAKTTVSSLHAVLSDGRAPLVPSGAVPFTSPSPTGVLT